MLAERSWPGLWVAVRTFGVFLIYTTMNSTRTNAFTLAFIFLAASSLCHLVMTIFESPPLGAGGRHAGDQQMAVDEAPQSKRLRRMLQSMTTVPLVVLCGLWEAINAAAFVTCVGKLHPFRASIGEFALYFVFAPPSSAASSSGVGADGNRAGLIRRVGCAVTGMLLLTWANNLDAGERGGGGGNGVVLAEAEEDRILVVDSIGGIVLLTFFAVSEHLRLLLKARISAAQSSRELRLLAPSIIAQSQSTHVVDMWSSAVGAVGLAAASFLFSVSSWPSWASSSSGPEATWSMLALYAVCTMLLVCLPVLVLHGNTKFQFVRYSRMHLPLKVAVATVTAFLLHVTFHAHYNRIGQLVEEAPHPATHLDNLCILCAGFVFAAGLFRSRASNETADDDTEALSYPSSSSASSADATIVLRILENPQQRKLACFLVLTLFFMLVELVYGMQANSIGLVSDSFHMLLDASSIVIGLYAAYMASWPRSAAFPFGYGRFETLSAFTNGVLLFAIAIFIFLESAGRVLDPPDVDSEHLLFVSVCGLSVNLIGVIFFHEAHAHGSSSSSHRHHDHDDGGGCCGGGNQQNMRGVYLHILADLLGSVSVIASSIIVRTTGFMISDPICSLLISVFILVSAVPLVLETGALLVQSALDASLHVAVRAAVNGALHLAEGCQNATIVHCRLWLHAKDVLVVDLAVRVECDTRVVALDSVRQRVLRAVKQAVGRRYETSVDDFATVEVEPVPLPPPHHNQALT